MEMSSESTNAGYIFPRNRGNNTQGITCSTEINSPNSSNTGRKYEHREDLARAKSAPHPDCGYHYTVAKSEDAITAASLSSPGHYPL
jgi:hypothetical protein